MYETALVLSVVVFVAVVLVFMMQPSASIFHPATFYLMFHGLVFVVRPIFGWYYGYRRVYDAMGFTPSVWEKTQTLICTNLALVVFMTVMVVLTRKPLQFRQNELDRVQRGMLAGRFLLVAFVLGSLAVYSNYWLLEFGATQAEGLTEVDHRTGYRAMKATNGYFLVAGSMLPPIVAIIAFLGRFRLWSLMPFIAFSIFRLSTGQRGDFVAAAVMIALLFVYDRRRKWPTFAVVAAAMVLAPVFTLIGTDRGAGFRELAGFENVREVDYDVRSNDKPLENLDLSNMEMVEYVVWAIPKRSGSYDYFLQNLQLFTEPIPRALWRDKPVGPPIRMFDLYSHARSISGVWSVPGMGWTYWGFPGVMIWSAFFAWIYASGYNLFARSRQSNLAVIAYMIFLSTATIAFRDGTVLTILKQSLPYFAPLAALAIVCRATDLPGKDQLRRLMTAQAQLVDRLRDKPNWRRRVLANSLEPTESREPSMTGAPAQAIAHGPRARRRAKMAELSYGPKVP